jgi:hypothetical protein
MPQQNKCILFFIALPDRSCGDRIMVPPQNKYILFFIAPPIAVAGMNRGAATK